MVRICRCNLRVKENVVETREKGEEMFVISQVIPSQASDNDKDLKIWLSGLGCYIQHSTIGIYLSETIPSTDPGTHEKQFKIATKLETKWLHNRGRFQEVRLNDTSNDANIINSKLVLTLKSTDTPLEKERARLVAQEQGNVDKP